MHYAAAMLRKLCTTVAPLLQGPRATRGFAEVTITGGCRDTVLSMHVVVRLCIAKAAICVLVRGIANRQD